MSATQKIELNSLDELLKGEINFLGYETGENSYVKTESGYRLYRLCNESRQSDCTSKWSLQINLNGYGTMHLIKKCNHINIC